MLLATNKLYADTALSVKKGDTAFLYNMDSDYLFGVFIAQTDGAKDIVPDAWGGKYPYQIRINAAGETKKIGGAKRILSRLGIKKLTSVDDARTVALVKLFNDPSDFDWNQTRALKKLGNSVSEKPRLEATTLWDFPKQSYGLTSKGNNKYAGVTPAFIIYNLVRRYTEMGDVVVDPMAGSGTTLDVCREEGRTCFAYDVSPPRRDVIQNDARKIPRKDETVDLVFVDSPYGDNIRYNEHPQNIGNISAENEEFYDELEKVMIECHRILKPGKVLAWLIGDQWVKKKFTPVGFNVYRRLCNHYDTVDIVCVARRGQTSNSGIWYNRAIRFNFYLRGFKYLFIMRKKTADQSDTSRNVKWTHYERGKRNH
jgi:DNA modification methylase